MTSTLGEDEAYRSSKVCYQQLSGDRTRGRENIDALVKFSLSQVPSSPWLVRHSAGILWKPGYLTRQTVDEQKPLKVHPVRETLRSIEVHFRKVPGTESKNMPPSECDQKL